MTWSVQRAAGESCALLWMVCGLLFVGCDFDERDPGVARGELMPMAGNAGAAGAPGNNVAGTGGSDCTGTDCDPQDPEGLRDLCLQGGCPADDVCRDYADAPAGGTPDAGCLTAADCPFEWKPSAREGEACECGADGCLLVLGEVCTQASVCSGGRCLPTAQGSSICCAESCSEAEVCSDDGSGCEPAEPCTEGDRRCSGALHQSCVAGVWETLTDCGELGCSAELDGCLRGPGESCVANTDCGQGSCLETAEGGQVCCTGPCDLSCQRCSASGTECVNVSDDEACGPIECPTDPCRLYDPATVVTDRCGAGQCKTPVEACAAFTPRNEDVACSATSLCDAQGNCSRPKRDVLAPCVTSDQCGSGACVATADGPSVCCGEACGPSEVCSANGTCVPAPVCEDDSTQCSGSNFQRCIGGQWTTVRPCGALGCSVQRNGCFAAPGEACTSTADCGGSATCQEGQGGARVCCAAACDGPCRVCSAAGTACANLQDDAECGAISCPADSTCRDFPASITTNRCRAGACGTAGQLCQFTARGEGQVCSATNLCNGSGDCSAPKRANGQSCSTGAQCASGNCADGTCCNQPCNGVCEACDTGFCGPAGGDPQCPIVSCGTSDTCTNTPDGFNRECRAQGQCRTAADCDFVPADTRSCGNPLTCDGSGNCTGPRVRCGNQACGVNQKCCSGVPAAGGNTQFGCRGANQSCGAGANPVPSSPGPLFEATCDQHADCQANEVCCLVGGNTNSGTISCVPEANCNAEDMGAELGAPPAFLIVGPLCRNIIGETTRGCTAPCGNIGLPDSVDSRYEICRQ